MKLIIYKEGRVEELPLEENTTVGRTASCGLQLDDPGLSGTHAEFIVDGESVTLRDLNSTNGTFVNDERITERVLRNGDSITIGKISILFSTATATPMGDAPASQPVSSPAGYAEDEPTPTDDDFAPEEKKPEEEKPAGAPRPELLAREGKWYLRENVTGKEVEIAPVRRKTRKAPPPALSSFSKFFGRHSLASAGAVIVFGFILSLFLRAIFMESATPTGTWSYKEYSTAIRRSIVEFDAGELGKAEYFLAMAADKYQHNNDLANLLLSVVSVWQDERRQDLREIERVLSAVGKYAGKDFADVSAWAARKQREVRREYELETAIAEIGDLVARGQLKEALVKLDKIPEDSRWYGEARKMTKELSNTISQGLLNLARRAMGTEDWKKALELLQKAADSGASASYIKKDMAACRRSKRDKEALENAREHFNAKKFEAAASRLAMITTDSYYHTQAKILRADIKRILLVETAERFYHRGDTRSALAALKGQEHNSACAILKKRILDVMKAFDDAEKLADAGRPDEAIKLWEEVVRLETNENNHYHSLSTKRLDKWRDHPENMAQFYIDKAAEAEAKSDYPTMKKYLAKGLEVNPGNEACLIKLKDLRKEAVQLMNEALVMRKRNIVRALKMFEQVIQMLPSDDPYTKEAQREIKRLQKRIRGTTSR